MLASIDLDAFYCGVEEREDPTLRDQPFCVTQKYMVITVSYSARALGVKKYASIASVKREHPNMRFINGEDLERYRKTGKMLFEWLQELIAGPVERLGLEELRFDLGPSIAQSKQSLPTLDELHSWQRDPEFLDDAAGRGIQLWLGDTPIDVPNFFFEFEGCTWPPGQTELAQAQSLDAYIAGHFIQYIRDRIWIDLGYSCSIGAASSKNYAKIVGGTHKPRGATVLIPGHEREFLQTIALAKIPGFGGSTRHALQNIVTVADLHAEFTRERFITRTASIIGAQTARYLWDMTLGADHQGAKIQQYELPKQVTIEDSYIGTPCVGAKWPSEIERLVLSVDAQTRVDCFDDASNSWLCTPESLRVTAVFTHGPYVRRSRSTRISWPISIKKLTVEAIKLLQELSVQTGAKLGVRTNALRLLNVGLIMRS